MLDVKITPFLSSLGMVRIANSTGDQVDCCGNKKRLGRFPLSERFTRARIIEAIRKTAIFLHLRATQLVGIDAAHVIGHDLEFFYRVAKDYAECGELWENAELISSLTPAFDLSKYLREWGIEAAQQRAAPRQVSITKQAIPVERNVPAKKTEKKPSQKPNRVIVSKLKNNKITPRERRAIDRIHHDLTSLPNDLREVVIKHFS